MEDGVRARCVVVTSDPLLPLPGPDSGVKSGVLPGTDRPSRDSGHSGRGPTVTTRTSWTPVPSVPRDSTGRGNRKRRRNTVGRDKLDDYELKKVKQKRQNRGARP